MDCIHPYVDPRPSNTTSIPTYGQYHRTSIRLAAINI
jgi:hypothetical protein